MNTTNQIDVSAVAAALPVIVNDQAAHTTLLTNVSVASAVLITVSTILLAVTRELVTTIDAAPIAIFTVPAGLLIVCAPVVHPAVIVLKSVGALYLDSTNASKFINLTSVKSPGT